MISFDNFCVLIFEKEVYIYFSQFLTIKEIIIKLNYNWQNVLKRLIIVNPTGHV